MNWVLLVFTCILAVHVTSFKRTYQIIFPGGETFSYAKLFGTIDRPLNDFTLCHWSRTNANDKPGVGNIFSYFSSFNENEIISFVVHNKRVHFIRYTGTTNVTFSIVDTEWLHVCNTWSIVGNRWQIFINGERFGQGNWPGPNYPIHPNGVVVLGQEQDTEDGGFDINDALTGQISEMHLWDYILTPSEVIKVHQCNHQEFGNVIDWNTVTWALYNGSRVSSTRLPCGQQQ